MSTWVEKWHVSSESDPMKYYTVSQADDGSFGCSCPSWTRNRYQCKHIRAVRTGHYTSFWSAGKVGQSPDGPGVKDAQSTDESSIDDTPFLTRIKDTAPWRFA